MYARERAPLLPPHDAAALASAVELTGARLVVLFGSRVTGRPYPRPDSDVDVGVRLGRREAAQEYWNVRRAFAPVFPHLAVDLVLLDTADPLLRWEILGPGQLLAGDVDEFLEYRAYAYRDFMDSADLRALEQRLFLKKLARLREATRAAS